MLTSSFKLFTEEMKTTTAFTCLRALSAFALGFCVALSAMADTTTIGATAPKAMDGASRRFHPPMTGGGTILSMTPQQTFATGASPNSVGAGDINGDGKPDLIVANYGDNTVSVLLNSTLPGVASPSFAGQRTFAAGAHPQSVAIADVNGDGKPDVVVANAVYPGTLSVLLNTTAPGAATASFAAAQPFATGGVPFSVVAVDLNGDGRPDLIVADTNSNSISVLLNTTATAAASPSFFAQQSFPVGVFPVSIAAADVNGDGRLDIVVVNSANSPGIFNGTISVLLNTTVPGSATASFAAQQAFDVGLDPRSIVATDLNGDGKPDLVVGNNGTTMSVLFNATEPGATAPNFAAQEIFAVAAYVVGAADLNGDGKPDLIVASFVDSSTEGTAWVLLNTTAPGAAIPSFVAQQTFATGLLPVSITTADINSDGKLDIIVANFASNTVSVLLNTPATITLDGYMSGDWFNPAQSGHGFQIEATNAIDPATGKPIMVAIWFAYTPDGSGQNWIYAQGTYDTTSNTVTLPAILNTGARFPPNFAPSDLTQTDWGNLTFSFIDCNHGTVTWSSPLPGYGMGSMPITRLTQIAGTTCPP